MQDVPLLLCTVTGFYVNGELWQYWREAFPRRLVFEMFDFVKCDIDDERAVFTRSLPWRGPQPPL